MYDQASLANCTQQIINQLLPPINKGNLGKASKLINNNVLICKSNLNTKKRSKLMSVKSTKCNS